MASKVKEWADTVKGNQKAGQFGMTGALTSAQFDVMSRFGGNDHLVSLGPAADRSRTMGQRLIDMGMITYRDGKHYITPKGRKEMGW